MGIYERWVLPRLINLACGTSPVQKQRAKIVPRARGDVLEIGIGSGINLPFYDPAKVNRIWGLEPSLGMRKLAEKRWHKIGCRIPLDFIDLPGEQIPLPDNVADTIVMTYTLCTIPDPEKALAGMRRVLKPDGQLLFCEHARAPDSNVQRWQDRLNPPWKKIAGGCHMNRPILDLLRNAGFALQEQEEMYLPGPRILGFNVWGVAVAS